MTTRKRPLTLPRVESLRGTPRNEVVVQGACRIGEREPQETLITDLNAGGCCLRAHSIGVTKGEAMQLWLGDHGPVAGRLRWVRKGSLGVAFDAPLADDILLPILAAPSAPIPTNVVPLRRSRAD